MEGTALDKMDQKQAESVGIHFGYSRKLKV